LLEVGSDLSRPVAGTLLNIVTGTQLFTTNFLSKKCLSKMFKLKSCWNPLKLCRGKTT